jgi:hypothetical protein
MYCPDLVSTSISSPTLTKSGTLTIAPVSRVTDFDPPPVNQISFIVSSTRECKTQGDIGQIANVGALYPKVVLF